ncbi:MAG: ABC transporter permease [Gallicola sp.]|nr:ABC transporter permease [Gallicola sp.]
MFKDKSLAILIPIVSIILAFIIGGIIMALTGQNPLEAYSFLLKGAFGSVGSIGETFVKAIPLVFTGLAATFAYRCGIFNLGGEGQFIMGAVASAALITAFTETMNPALLLIISLIIGTIVGGLWGVIPGLLKAYFSLNEMIITILLNYIAVLFMDYLYSGPLKEANIPQTMAVEQSSQLSKIFPGTRIHLGLVIAIIVVAVLYYFLFHTSNGFKLRAVGLNPEASRVNGYDVKKILILTFIISGAIAGLGGSVELHGAQYRLMAGFGDGFGFDGVAIALIGQLNPIGTLLVAYFFAILRTGANAMQIATGISTTVVDIIQALVIIFVIGSSYFTSQSVIPKFFNRFTRRKKDTNTEEVL